MKLQVFQRDTGCTGQSHNSADYKQSPHFAMTKKMCYLHKYFQYWSDMQNYLQVPTCKLGKGSKMYGLSYMHDNGGTL